jgi:integrase
MVIYQDTTPKKSKFVFYRHHKNISLYINIFLFLYMIVLNKSIFSKYLEREPLRPRTIELYLSLFGQMDKLFGSMEKPEMDKVKEYLKAHPRPYHFAALYYYCQAKYGLTILRPGRKYSIPEKIPRTYPTYKEFREAYDNIYPLLSDTERTIIELRVFSGRRISEVLMLRVSRIDFENGKIIFEVKGHGGQVRYSSTRMSPKINLLLKNYIKDKELLGGDYLFYRHSNNPHTKHPEKAKYMQFRDKLEKIDSQFARLFLRTHDIRHAVISKIIIEKGLPNASAWVGHKSLNTTKQYADEISTEKLRDDAYEVMSDA